MPLSEEDERTIDQALQAWRQGDVSLAVGLEFLHFADLSRPHSPASTQVAEVLACEHEAIESWTHARAGRSAWCGDAQSDMRCRSRLSRSPPLIEVPGPRVEDIRRLKRPAFAYVPRHCRQASRRRPRPHHDRREGHRLPDGPGLPAARLTVRYGTSQQLSLARDRDSPFPMISLPQPGTFRSV